MARQLKPKPLDYQITFPQLWAMLDETKITDAIVGTASISEVEFSDAKLLVYGAAGRWLIRDLEDFQITAVEQEFRTEGEYPIKGFLDIQGIVRDLPGTNGFKELAGKKLSVDWKTSKRDLDATWADRLIQSWQYKIYAWAHDLSLFAYRGIKRPAGVSDPVRFREINLIIPSYNAEEVQAFIKTIYQARRMYTDGKFTIWAQNRPEACTTYGRECEFLEDCQGYTMPREALLDKVLSYSSIKTFQSCPERHRRVTLLAQESDEEVGSTPETIFGQLVHRGLAAVYEQALVLEKNGELA